MQMMQLVAVSVCTENQIYLFQVVSSVLPDLFMASVLISDTTKVKSEPEGFINFLSELDMFQFDDKMR